MLELCKKLKLETVLWFFWNKTDLSCQRQKPSSILADPKILLQFRTFSNFVFVSETSFSESNFDSKTDFCFHWKVLVKNLFLRASLLQIFFRNTSCTLLILLEVFSGSHTDSIFYWNDPIWLELCYSEMCHSSSSSNILASPETYEAAWKAYMENQFWSSQAGSDWRISDKQWNQDVVDRSNQPINQSIYQCDLNTVMSWPLCIWV